MGIFKNNNKITIKKENEDNGTKIYVDYDKLKMPNEFKSSLIKELIGDNQSLVVIDTKLTYRESALNIKNEVNILIELLEENSINYRNIITKGDNNYTILGFPVKLGNSPKITNHVIGFVALTKDIEKLERILDKFNMIYYIVSEDTNIDELLNIFDSARGDMEDLNNKYPYNIYNDNFFNKARICTKDENVKFIEDVINLIHADTNPK